MDLNTLAIEDIRKLDQAGLRETEIGIRRELATIRMDVYSPAAAAVGKVRKLRSGLARILTIKTEILRQTPKVVKVATAPKAAVKKVAAPKKVKAEAKTKALPGKKKV